MSGHAGYAGRRGFACQGSWEACGAPSLALRLFGEARACTSASGRQMSAFVTKLPFLYYDIIIFSKYFWGEELFVGKTAMCTLRFLRMGLGLGGF